MYCILNYQVVIQKKSSNGYGGLNKTPSQLLLQGVFCSQLLLIGPKISSYEQSKILQSLVRFSYVGRRTVPKKLFAQREGLPKINNNYYPP